MLLLVGMSARDARAVGARLRWQPIDDVEAAGYRVYMRTAGTPYGEGIDVGTPDVEPDGAMSQVVHDLAEGGTYYFAVTAYDAGQHESEFDGELALGPTEPCVIDSCTSRTSCEFGIRPDGVPCQGPAPCGVCAAATCTGQAARTLAVKQVQSKTRGKTALLTATGRFAVLPGFDPTTTGVAVEISDPGNRVLYRGTVPGSALRWNRARSAVRLVRSLLPRDAAPGLQRLRLRRGKGGVAVVLRLSAPELIAVRTLGRLSWELNFGTDECVADGDLVCGGSWARTVCR